MTPRNTGLHGPQSVLVHACQHVRVALALSASGLTGIALARRSAFLPVPLAVG